MEIHLPSAEPQIHKQGNQDPAESSQDQPTLSGPTDAGGKNDFKPLSFDWFVTQYFSVVLTS